MLLLFAVVAVAVAAIVVVAATARLKTMNPRGTDQPPQKKAKKSNTTVIPLRLLSL